ncbi:MAG: GntR family transcriptional regulator [Zoogloea oleivorans]|jgi:DNA-binding GntR family transcriptional regulator|uniref:GntR family transcriptional regulator n=1 Tax=Zoogloea oleivorans TaxID=1552750 RepID=UPI002A35C23C|nr:GntR family transcriptional regulator [Zoogloea oleivorans]MDY0036386.1 GntR family transcriptional regulator [Zoogloea oleivorans]
MLLAIYVPLKPAGAGCLQWSPLKMTSKPRPAPRTPAMPPATTAKRGTIAVDLQIYKAVFNAVMSQRLPPGTRLGEAEFCELYQVSRTTVRKALQRLAHEHIIELRPNRGAVVASPSPDEARQVFAARRAIEREIVPLVIRNAGPAALTRLRLAIQAEHQALHAGDRPNWIRLGGEFHLLLAELAGNTVLQRFMSELVSRCSLIIALYDTGGAPMCADDEHEHLVQLMEAGRAEEATTLMESHLQAIETRLRLGEPKKKLSLAEALSG